jgi:hypothetical protein
MSILAKANPKVYRSPSAGGHARYQLAAEIIARSVGDTWDDAKREWDLAHVFISAPDEPGTCLCGHHPIREHCLLTNRENGNEAVVGNVCVTKFMGLSSEKLFAAFRRIAKNREAALNAEAVDYAHRTGWIDDWQRRFYLDTCRRSRRKLSQKQLAKRVEINRKVLARVAASRGEGSHHV